jgi:hypothetical protein
MKLFEGILDELQRIGYDLVSACEILQKFKEEVKSYPPGKYTYYCGTRQFTFTKV